MARVWLALLVVYVVWGSTYLAIRLAIDTLPPLLMAATRFLLAGGLLFAWAARRGDRDGDALGWPQWRAAAIVGAGFFLGGNGGVVFAEARIASGVAALLVATLPVWMALLTWLFHGERPSRPAMIGLPLGFAGMALLVGPVQTSGIDPIGAGAVVLGSFCWAAASLYSRTAPLPSRTAVSTGMQMLTGGVWLTIAGLASGELGRMDPTRFSTASLGALAYLVVFGSILAFTAYAWLIRNAPISLVSTYAYVNPVVAVGLGWVVLGEPVTPRMLVAGTIILVAVGLIASASQSKRTDSTMAPSKVSSFAKSGALAPATSVSETDPGSAA